MHGKPRDTVNRDTVNRETIVVTADDLNKNLEHNLILYSSARANINGVSYVTPIANCSLPYDVISCSHGFSGHVTGFIIRIFSISAYMNFDKNLIHGAITPFQGEPDAEKIRKIDQEMAKCCSDKAFFVNATLLYILDDFY